MPAGYALTLQRSLRVSKFQQISKVHTLTFLEQKVLKLPANALCLTHYCAVRLGEWEESTQSNPHVLK